MQVLFAFLVGVGVGVLLTLALGRLLARPPERAGEPKKIRSLNEHRAAVHEAGHAVCAWLHPRVRITRITIDDCPPGQVGRVELMGPVTPGDDASLWCDIVVSLGGIAAEVHRFNLFRSGQAAPDLERAVATARVLVERGSTTSPWGGPDPTSRSGLDLSVMLRSVQAGSPEANVLNACYDRAKVLVARQEARLDRVVQGTLGPREVRAIFGWRLPLFGGGIEQG